MRFRLPVLILLLSLSFSAVQAQSPAQTLGTCLTDHTTGQDRKDLARWVFTALAAHPEIDSLSAVTATDRRDAAQRVGAIFTRLLSESCANEVRAAIDAGGGSVIEKGFGILGRVAMQELMRSPEVSAAMEDVTQHIDRERLKEAHTQK